MIESAGDILLAANNTLLYNTEEMAAMGLLFTLSIVGMIGSGAIIFSSFYYQQTPHGLIILSLCLGDLLSCINVFIASVANLVRGGLQNGQAGLDKCMIEGFIQMISFSISLVSLTLVAAERYFAVFYGVHDHSRKVVFAIVCSWVYAIGYASTSMTSGSNFRLMTGRLTCGPLCTNSDMFPLCVFVGVATTAGSSLAVFFYWKLYMFYRYSVNRQKKSTRDAKEKKLLRKFTIIVLSFLIMTLPFLCCFFYEIITGNNTSPIIGIFTTILLCFNATLNPYLLYFLDSSIKQQVDQVFKNWLFVPQTDRSENIQLFTSPKATTASTPIDSKIPKQPDHSGESQMQTMRL